MSKEILAAIIFALGAILAVIIARIIRRPRIKARLWAGVHENAQGSPETVFFLEATNKGWKSISLSEAYVSLPKSVKNLPLTSNNQFPFKLKPRKACRVWLKGDYLASMWARDFRDLQEMEMIGVFIDSAGKKYESNLVKLKRKTST
jgi:hypothetical protein